MILNSYKTIRGTPSMIWVITSGGVNIAAPIKNIKIAYLRFFFRKSTETIPILP